MKTTPIISEDSRLVGITFSDIDNHNDIDEAIEILLEYRHLKY